MRAAAQGATPAAGGTPVTAPVITGGGGTPEDTLEIFSWWTTGGEAAGLQKLFDAFSANWPDVKIVNAAVAGGAGSNAQLALQTRLNGGEPPDSWQSHPGQELFSLYVDPGYTDTVTALWEEQGWNDVYPKGLIDQITFDGEKYLVPVGVHRGNVRFDNKKLMSDNGVEVGDELTVDQFMQAADALKGAGVPALALGSQDTFATAQLLENCLLAQLGPDGYVGLWDGSTPWDGDDVTSGIQTMADMLKYVNSDHSALTWDGATDKVIEGSAGFTSMGDWAWGQVIAKNATDAVGWVAHAGSAGSFVSVVDGFTMPKGAPHPVNAGNWLRTVGSAEAQTAFAPDKGAIPARTDVDTSGFNDYMQWSAGDFSKDTVVPSMAHGAAASPQWRQSILDAGVSFLASMDVGSFQDELVSAAEDAKASQ
jgi:glucose/mannose transport system substrate-binding protein